LCNYAPRERCPEKVTYQEGDVSERKPQPDEITREEVRPGLTLIKRRTLKEDGRYLIYYDFERTAEAIPTALEVPSR
jgi:hypothetical protein